MKLGIKVGPNNNWKQDVEATNPAMVEVWFDINRLNEYQGLFAYLATQPIETGLHFWGALPDGTMANICYPDEAVTKASVALIQKTIDVATQHNFAYVNIHTGSRRNYKIDFVKQDHTWISEPADAARCRDQFLEQYKILHDYAKSKNVILTVETVSRLVAKSDWHNPASRLNTPLYLGQLPLEVDVEAVRRGFWIANDFVHTATQCVSDNPTDIWQTLKTFTAKTAADTKLIHLGFLVPPFNGTDNHDSLDNPILDSNNALPNKKQIIELLQFFKNRNDVWILVEPNGGHVKNYFLAQKLLADAGVLT